MTRSRAIQIVLLVFSVAAILIALDASVGLHVTERVLTNITGLFTGLPATR